MTEKTFEELFPSLKDKVWKNKDMEIGSHIEENAPVTDSNFFITDEDVMKHCLDKQRVKEAVRECFDECNSRELSRADLLARLDELAILYSKVFGCTIDELKEEI